ncbi:MAG: hypothetical protein P8Y03_30250, partial [Anaerolineales bacterium]
MSGQEVYQFYLLVFACLWPAIGPQYAGCLALALGLDGWWSERWLGFFNFIVPCGRAAFRTCRSLPYGSFPE